MQKTEYRFKYSFTEDEIIALAEIYQTMPESSGREVIGEILELVSIDGYRADGR